MFSTKAQAQVHHNFSFLDPPLQSPSAHLRPLALDCLGKLHTKCHSRANFERVPLHRPHSHRSGIHLSVLISGSPSSSPSATRPRLRWLVNRPKPVRQYKEARSNSRISADELKWPSEGLREWESTLPRSRWPSPSSVSAPVLFSFLHVEDLGSKARWLGLESVTEPRFQPNWWLRAILSKKGRAYLKKRAIWSEGLVFGRAAMNYQLYAHDLLRHQSSPSVRTDARYQLAGAGAEQSV